MDSEDEEVNPKKEVKIEGEEDVEEENLEFDEEEDITVSPEDVGTDGDDGNIPEAGEKQRGPVRIVRKEKSLLLN